MYVCMYVYIYVSMYVSRYISILVCTYVCIYVYRYAYMYVCMYVCTYVCLHARRYVCMQAAPYVGLQVSMHGCAQPHPPSPSTIPVHSPSPAKTGVGKRPDRAVPPAACSAEAEGPPRAELEREPPVAAPPCPASWTLSSLGQQLPSPDPQSQFPWGTTLVGSTPLGRSVAAVGAQAPRTTSPARVPLAGCPSHTPCSPTPHTHPTRHGALPARGLRGGRR